MLVQRQVAVDRTRERPTVMLRQVKRYRHIDAAAIAERSLGAVGRLKSNKPLAYQALFVGDFEDLR